jgi:DNA-binding LacI/PurR family transcriptional regulator
VAVVSHAYTLARERGWLLRKFPVVLQTLEKAGLPLAGGDVFASAEAFGAWLEKSRGKKVDAVLCEDDSTAARVVGAMALLGMRTPRDALVVGCDADFMLPGTWSVRVDAEVLAGMVVDLLRKALESEGAVESVAYKPEVVEQEPKPPPQTW